MFTPASVTTRWVELSWVDLDPGHIVVDGVPAPAKGSQQPPLFGPCLLWPRSPISATAEYLYKRSPIIAENYNRLSRVYERYRQTTDGRASEREREFIERPTSRWRTARPNQCPLYGPWTEELHYRLRYVICRCAIKWNWIIKYSRLYFRVEK